VAVNGRNYLDLIELATGVAVNWRMDPEKDGAAPVLGERGGNAICLIDGMTNRNAVDGGASAALDQDSIQFFNVLNRANAVAVEEFECVAIPSGRPRQYLPGREGQAGLRIEF